MKNRIKVLWIFPTFGAKDQVFCFLEGNTLAPLFVGRRIRYPMIKRASKSTKNSAESTSLHILSENTNQSFVNVSNVRHKDKVFCFLDGNTLAPFFVGRRIRYPQIKKSNEKQPKNAYSTSLHILSENTNQSFVNVSNVRRKDKVFWFLDPRRQLFDLRTGVLATQW